MRRKRQAPRYDPDWIRELRRLVKPTLKFTWTKWYSVGLIADTMGLDADTIMMLVRESTDLALHRGWRVLKDGEKVWIPISDNPRDYLIKTRSV